MYWEALNKEAIRKRVLKALTQNINYDHENLMGVPASYLDQKQFSTRHPVLKEAPFLLTMIHNPNHIGCHTFTQDQSEEYFRGTQLIELELLETLATQVFKAEEQNTDGYIAPGGTEANIQAQWIYRNFYQYEMAAKLNEIAVVYSSDAHYSMPKGANILGLQDLVIPVDESSRMWDLTALDQQLKEAENSGIRFLIITLNMGTTMFGSVDKIDAIIEVLNRYNFDYKIHIDGAFGGFIYPFTNEANPLNFSHPAVNSITVDAHKMLQAPYGTGIFLIRKGWMQYTTCEEAKYVSGLDSTICGSRSGANAIATWMIIMGYGSEGWTNNCKNLYSRTLKLCEGLDELGINYFHQEFMNIVTIKASDIPADIAHKYHLVPDNQDKPNWFKIVVMPHVTSDMVERFLNNLRLQIWVNA